LNVPLVVVYGHAECFRRFDFAEQDARNQRQASSG
jgi:hypothetical protein